MEPADLGFNIKSDFNNIKDGRKQAFTAGIAITNLGAKIAYSESGNSDFLPTNLRIGGGYHLQIDEYNLFSVYLDINRLLVPTPPEFGANDSIIAGVDSDDMTPLIGVIQSFNPKAKPGGFTELLQENIYNFGMSINTMISCLQEVVIYKSTSKGNRQYVTLGFGLVYNVFN